MGVGYMKELVVVNIGNEMIETGERGTRAGQAKNNVCFSISIQFID